MVLTPAALKGSGMLAKTVELANRHGWFLCRQFKNQANADTHSRTTAPEILAAFEGERLDCFVTSFGTDGTLKGVARVLRKARPLSARTSVSTIPQIFVGGTFVGGCTDLFDSYKAGRLQALLDEHHVAYDRSVRIDPYSFLPSWLHPR